MTQLSKKIVLLGDFSVGKTSLIRRFVENAFDDRYLSTIGVKISRKPVEIFTADTPAIVQLLLWDIEGKTPVKSIPKSYLLGASGAGAIGAHRTPVGLLARGPVLYAAAGAGAVGLRALGRGGASGPGLP